MRKSIHQGDVFLQPIDALPETAKEIRKEIVQYGEITGHAHRIQGAVIFGDGKNEYINVPVPAPMTHDDHPMTSRIVGLFKKIIQQEYFPDGSRQVKD